MHLMFGPPRRAALSLAAALVSTSALDWEPTRPVEFAIPAGTGFGADQGRLRVSPQPG